MKSKKEAALALRIVASLQLKRFEKWIGKLGVFNRYSEKQEGLGMESEPITMVYEPDENTQLLDFEIDSQEHTEKSIFDYMSEELKEQYEQDVSRVCNLFKNELFIKAYLSNDNDMMLNVIELLYGEGNLDYELLCELQNIKLVTLSEANIEHFKEIGLIPTFNNGDNGVSLS